MDLGTFLVVLVGVAALWSIVSSVDAVADELRRLSRIIEDL